MLLLDISNHQRGLDIDEAVAGGFSAVLMKATEGTTFKDASFDSFAEGVLASGAVPGAYHYLRSGSGSAQADAFFSRVQDHGGPNGWLAACDNESDADWWTTRDFFSRWSELTGGHPLFMYSGAWWWSTRGWDGASLTPYLWTSRYVSGSGTASSLYAAVPSSWWTPGYGGWGSATLLQFTSNAKVAGWYVDASAYLGTLDGLRRLTTTEDEMDLSDSVSGTATEDHGGTDRSVAEVLADVWCVLMDGRTVGGPLWSTSPMASIGTTLTDEQLATLASAVTADLATRIGVPVERLVSAVAAAGDALSAVSSAVSED